MNIKLKLLPAIITLLAGAVTSIITFCLHYESRTALLVLLIVLLLFYMMGTILQRIIFNFEIKNARAKAAEEEGKVVEKNAENSESAGQTEENAASEKNPEQNKTGSGDSLNENNVQGSQK